MKYWAIYLGDEYNGDIFDLNSSNNRDNCQMPFYLLREMLRQDGIELRYLSEFAPPYEEVKCVLLFNFNVETYSKIFRNRLETKTILVAFEPPAVIPEHCTSGIKRLRGFFKAIITWDDAALDGIKIFKSFAPYYFEPDFSTVPFEDRKLLACISGNKSSSWPDELYSERLRVIKALEENPQFELYGTNWDDAGLQCYKGTVASKKETYQAFRFALCLENNRNVQGYITEKILDCFCAGVVPVYGGASNVCDYIPRDCFIDYFAFHNPAELFVFLQNMREAEYYAYIESIRKFLASDAKSLFETSAFKEAVFKAQNAENEGTNSRFSIGCRLLIKRLRMLIKRIKRKLFRVLRIK